MSDGVRMRPRGYAELPERTKLDNCCAQGKCCEAGKFWKIVFCCCIGGDFECGYGPVTFLLNSCSPTGLLCPWCWCDCVWCSDGSRNRWAWRGFGDDDCICGRQKNRVYPLADGDPREQLLGREPVSRVPLGTRQHAGLVAPQIVMRMDN